MKKYLFALIALWAGAVWGMTPAELSMQLQKPASIQGQFVQQRVMRSLAKPMQTSGEFALLPKKGLFWQMQKPFALQLRVRSDGIAQWDGQKWQNAAAQAGQNAQLKLFMAVLGGDVGELEKQFSASLSGNPDKWQLKLTPKTVISKQIFSHITIRGGAFVEQVTLAEKQGDQTVMTFSHIRANAALNPAVQRALP